MMREPRAEWSKENDRMVRISQNLEIKHLQPSLSLSTCESKSLWISEFVLDLHFFQLGKDVK